MAWSLTYGEYVKVFEDRARRTGVVPPPLQNRPRLQPQDMPYIEAFNCVSRGRPIGDMGGTGRIAVSEIHAYLQVVGIANKSLRVKYLRLIQMLDDVFVGHYLERDKLVAKANR